MSGGLTETERGDLGRIIRWHMACDNEEPGKFVGLCILNIEGAVERIVAEREAAAARRVAEQIEDAHKTADRCDCTYKVAARIARGGTDE